MRKGRIGAKTLLKLNWLSQFLHISLINQSGKRTSLSLYYVGLFFFLLLWEQLFLSGSVVLPTPCFMLFQPPNVALCQRQKVPCWSHLFRESFPCVSWVNHLSEVQEQNFSHLSCGSLQLLHTSSAPAWFHVQSSNPDWFGCFQAFVPDTQVLLLFMRLLVKVTTSRVRCTYFETGVSHEWRWITVYF